VNQPKLVKLYSENSDFQRIETLQRNRTTRSRSREFFVEGVRPINQAIENGWAINAFVYSREKRLSRWAEELLAQPIATTHYELPLRLVEKLSDKKDTSELLALVAMPPDDLARIPMQPNLLVVVFDRPANPGNLGAIIRSCDALRVDGLIITGHAVDLYDPETIRATTGSFFAVPAVRLASHQQLAPWFEQVRNRTGSLQIVGTSAKAELPIAKCDFTPPTVLVIGNETHGLGEAYRALCDHMVTIPMDGSATSLNVACATSIMLYEIDRQRRRSPREK
jgi:tRNA G18 (ribose-2'-O)-methylase SpoU